MMRTVARYECKRTRRVWTLLRDGPRLMCLEHPPERAWKVGALPRVLWCRHE